MELALKQCELNRFKRFAPSEIPITLDQCSTLVDKTEQARLDAKRILAHPHLRTQLMAVDTFQRIRNARRPLIQTRHRFSDFAAMGCLSIKTTPTGREPTPLVVLSPSTAAACKRTLYEFASENVCPRRTIRNTLKSWPIHKTIRRGGIIWKANHRK